MQTAQPLRRHGLYGLNLSQESLMRAMHPQARPQVLLGLQVQGNEGGQTAVTTERQTDPPTKVHQVQHRVSKAVKIQGAN